VGSGIIDRDHRCKQKSPAGTQAHGNLRDYRFIYLEVRKTQCSSQAPPLVFARDYGVVNVLGWRSDFLILRLQLRHSPGFSPGFPTQELNFYLYLFFRSVASDLLSDECSNDTVLFIFNEGFVRDTITPIASLIPHRN
jgi:hypothetical protein